MRLLDPEPGVFESGGPQTVAGSRCGRVSGLPFWSWWWVEWVRPKGTCYVACLQSATPEGSELGGHVATERVGGSRPDLEIQTEFNHSNHASAGGPRRAAKERGQFARP